MNRTAHAVKLNLSALTATAHNLMDALGWGIVAIGAFTLLRDVALAL